MPKPTHTVGDVLRTAGFLDPSQKYFGKNWEFWTANYLGPVRTTKENLLFLTGDCGWADLEDVATWMRTQNLKDPLVVIKNSARRLQESSKSLERVKEALRTRNVFPITEFLFKFAQRALGDLYQTDITAENLGLQYFTEPDVHFPDTESPSRAVKPLLRWLNGASPSESNVAVLLAPAAFGKSTLSEQLFLELGVRKGSIPVLIQRDQWAELVGREPLQMEDIWAAAVRKCYPDALIGPGQLETFLRTGVLSFVFDGLDELCAVFPSHFNPTDTVEDLVNLFDDARAIITSRTQFWEENIQEATKRRVLEIELKPFTPGQREQYLINRFPDETEKREQAKRILDRIGGKAQSTAGVEKALDDPSTARVIQAKTAKFETIPFVVMLSAESADTEQHNVISRYGALLSADDPVEGLLLALCDRERVRYNLKLEPSRQLAMFELLAVEFGPVFQPDDILLCLQEIKAPEDEYNRMFSHALLRSSRRLFRFQYDFVEEYLIARRIKKWLIGTNGTGTGGLNSIVHRQGSVIDRCAQLISGQVGEWERVMMEKWKSLPEDPTARSGFVSLALGLVKRFTRGSRRDHTDVLLQIFDGLSDRVFSALDFRTSVTAFDLRDVTFQNCVFTNVEFSNCVFNERTKFTNCTFRDQFAVVNCDEFRFVQFGNCAFSLIARGVVQREQGQQKFPVTRTQIVGAVRDTLRYFQMGSAGFANRKVDLLNQRLRHIPFAETLLATLEDSHVLERQSLSNVEEFMLVRTAEARVFLQNGTRVGHIKKAIDKLESKFG